MKQQAMWLICALISAPFWMLLSSISISSMSFDLALYRLNKLDWFVASIVMTVCSYLYAYYCAYEKIVNSVSVEQNVAIYSVLYFHGFFFLFYPGERVLGVDTPQSLYFLFGIPVVHYFAVKNIAIQLAAGIGGD